MLLQHLRLSGELRALKLSSIAKLYHRTLAYFCPSDANPAECTYGPLAKSGIIQAGLSENVAHTIASYTY